MSHPLPVAPHSNRQSQKPKRKKRPKKSIRLDRVHPKDFLGLNLRYACEHCSHFSSTDSRCTMGFNPPQHLLADQAQRYEYGGRIAFCRFLEID